MAPPALAGLVYGLFCLGALFGSYAGGYPVHCRTTALGPPGRRRAGRDRLVQMGLHALSFVSGRPVGFMWK